MKAIQHVVRSVDTIQSIAANYLSDAKRWQEIVDFNNLDYPYIATTPGFTKDTKASGKVQLERNYTVLVLPIPRGTMFYSASSDGTPQRTYTTTIDYYMQPGQATVEVYVECTVSGVWGNVPSHAITGLYQPSSTLQGAFKTIANPIALSNGKTLNVRGLGESLLIPVETTQNETYTDIDDFYKRHFGADLELGSDGDMTSDAYGDIGGVAGTLNLKQSIESRLVTAKEELLYHREYGSILKRLTQEGNADYIDKWIRLAIEETLLADDRIDAVNVVGIQRMGPTMYVTVDVTPVTRADAIRLELALPIAI